MRLSAVLLRVREWASRNGRRAALLAVLVGVAAGAVLSVAAGARRVASAPDRYTAALGGEPDLLLYQTEGAPLTGAVRTVPGVIDALSSTFTAAWPVTANPDDVFELTTPFTGTAAALGALVVEGREADPAAPDEFTANRAFVQLAGAELGDRFEIMALDDEQLRSGSFDDPPAIAPFESTLVGITESAGDFENPAPLVTYSSGMLTEHPDIGIVATFIIVDTEPGVDIGDVVARARSLPGGDTLQRTPEGQYVSADVRRAVTFVSVSLWIVAGVAGLALALVIVLLVTQLVGPPLHDRLTLRAVGWQRRDFALEALLESAAIALVVVATATVVAIATSGLFPFGATRILEPNPGLAADAVVLVGGAVAILVVWAVPAVIKERWPHRERSPRSTRTFGASVTRALWSLPIALGVRHALEATPRRRTALATLAPGIVGCAGCVAALTVGLSIDRLVDDPERRGVNVDYVYGNQYVPQFDDIVTPAREDPDVQDLAAATVGTLSIDGIEVNVLAFEPVRGSADPVSIEGRAPITADEIGLGREILRDLDKELGDTVQVIGPSGLRRELTIVGVVVTPADAGGGAAVTYETYEELVPDATRNLLLVGFADDAAPDAYTRLAEATGTDAGRDLASIPTSIGAVQRVLPMPYLLAAILASLGAVALMQALVTSVNDRRHDFGVMRALGAVGGQVRSLLHWQATTVAAVVLLLGVPLGLLGGRLVFGAIADRIGVAPDPRLAWALLPLLVAIVVVITNTAALLPGVRAARVPTLDLVAER